MAHDHGRPASADAVEAWVLATIPRALAYARSLLRDRARSEDVVHDCYVRLLRKAGEGAYDLPADGTKLLFKAITNACLDAKTRDRRLLSLDELSDLGADARAVDPLRGAEHRELEEALGEGLGRLNVAQRAAVELRSLGYSLDEIADALGTTSTNAGVLVHRARKALANHLGRFLEADGDEPR